MTDLERFTAAYIECALWSSTDESDERGGEPMDRNYSVKNFAPETLARMQADCAKFIEENRQVLDYVESTGEHGDTYAVAGHDFWLSRNHHGAGFWDGDWQTTLPATRTVAGDVLTDAAHKFGEFNLYVGDDGQVWS